MSLSLTVEPFVADIGITLRDGRIQRGLTIDQVAQETRISARFLEALEAEAFDELPAPVYVRGFLRSYANFLRIDAGPLLEQLGAATNRPVSGPDSFVGGAPGVSRGPRQRPPTNPFRTGTPAPRPASRPSPVVPPDAVVMAGALAAAEDEGWAPEAPAEAFDEPPQRYAPGPAGRDAFEDSYDDTPPELEYRPRRVAGVLMERETAGGSGPAPTRLLAIAGGAVVVVLFFLAVAVIMTRGGGNSTNGAAPAASPSPTLRPGTVIAVGSAALPSATASPGASPSASPSAAASPGASPSPSVAPATPTPVPQGSTPAPTAAATPTPTLTATPTTAPPTATPRPPTPAPTPVPSHPNGYALCTGSSNCGDLSPFIVVCPPDGTWYLDPTGKNNPYNWRTSTTVRLQDASGACH